MSKGKRKINREYESRGLSAHPDWWAIIERESEELGINRSAFIRMAVNEYLKEDGAKVTGMIPAAA